MGVGIGVHGTWLHLIWASDVTNNTTSLGIGLVMLAMLAYGIVVLVQGFINGEKRRLLRSRPPFTVTPQGVTDGGPESNSAALLSSSSALRSRSSLS